MEEALLGGLSPQVFLRRYWQKRSAKAASELLSQLAVTLDALIREPY